jgi:hypothetical protein
MAQVLKPTSVAQAPSGGNCTLGLKSMAQVLKPTSVAQARSGGNRTLGLKSMAQVPKPTRWHKSTLTVASKPTPVARADSGRNLKPAPAAKLLVFSDFSRFGFPESAFHFLHLKSTPRGTKSTSSVAYQSPLRAAS